MTACGCCRTAARAWCLPSGDPSLLVVPTRDRRDDAGRNEVIQRRRADADVTTDPDELDPPLGDQSPRESLAGTEDRRDLRQSEKAFRGLALGLRFHAALPVAERSGLGGSPARRLASAS